MKKLLLLALLSACGGEYHIVASGTTVVEYRIDLMTEYFQAYCKDLYPDSQDAQDYCVRQEMAKLLKVLEGQTP